MELQELQKWIKDNLFNNNFIIPKKVSLKAKWIKENPFIYKTIIEYTNFLPVDCVLNRRIYHIINNMFYIPKCKLCDNFVKYKSFSKGYSDYCGQKCVSKVRKNKFKEKHGVNSPLQKNEFLEKSNKTKELKYNNKNYNNREKAKQTNLEKYGVENPLQNETIKNKCIKTNLEKYGVKYPQLNNEIRNKSEETLQQHYGLSVKNPFEIKEIQNKIKNDRKEKTGFYYNSQVHITNIDKLNKDYIESHFISDEHIFDLDKFQRFYNLSRSHSYKKLKELNVYYEKTISIGESEVKNYIESISENVVCNDRKIIEPKELDFYIPNNNLAIEYNGNYYHCDSHERITYKYHLDKTERCLKQNIQLLHIFEHQWNDYFKRDIWKSILSGKLGKNNVIFGRKCKIVNINNKEKNNFLNKNHLQGTCNSSIDLGLIYSNELVAVMTFGKPRFNKNSEWELLRFCNKKFHTVIGGASKLFKYFIKKYKGNIVTYADRTYSNGGLYNKLGFDLIKTNSPSYFYFKNNEIISRYKSQKSKLGKLLENYNSDLTEYQNMLENGYHRVWDCGTLVFKYKN